MYSECTFCAPVFLLDTILPHLKLAARREKVASVHFRWHSGLFVAEHYGRELP